MSDEQDAKRYRWLNKQHNFVAYIEGATRTRQHVNLRCGVPLDEWIDARISEEVANQDNRRTE